MPQDSVQQMPDSGRGSPQRIYVDRQRQHLENQTELEAADARFSTARGLVFLVGLSLCWFVFVDTSLHMAWLLFPLAVFGLLVVFHARIAARLQRTRRAVAYYHRALDRLADRWSGVGPSGERYVDHDHPCAGDLDLFGDGSLFQLLCGSRTRLGEDMLAAWLKIPAEPAEIRRRQAAVTELRDQIEFRETMALLDAEVHDEFDQSRLAAWAAGEAMPMSRVRRTIATALGILAVFTLAAWGAGFGVAPFLIVVLFEIPFFATIMRDLRHSANEADEACAGLAILAQVLELLERHAWQSPELQEVRRRLETDGHPPSWQIARLRNHIQNVNNSLQNQFFGPIAFLLGLPVHLIHRVEGWRERVGPHIGDWLTAVGELEAFSSIACYSFEHPDDPYPEIVDPALGPVFDAQQIGHPLIVADKCVRNDIRMDASLSLVMISGSNMSGKSTMLRTVGINCVLALCGAPVRAESLRISPLVVGSAMRVHDSLQQGASLFYSVISRIKSVVELAGQTPPLLFLLDEILQGTNSHDRRVGAEGIIRQLVERGAIGLVTTHDLALTDIVESFNGRATNIHFEDHLISGKMYFDYRIRTGVVRKSNALELMRLIGLDVGDDAAAKTSSDINRKK